MKQNRSADTTAVRRDLARPPAAWSPTTGGRGSSTPAGCLSGCSGLTCAESTAE